MNKQIINIATSDQLISISGLNKSLPLAAQAPLTFNLSADTDNVPQLRMSVFHQVGCSEAWGDVLVFSLRTSPNHLQLRTTTVCTSHEETTGGKA